MTRKNLILLVVIVGAVAWYAGKQQAGDPAPSPDAEAEPLLAERPSQFHCDGKSRCSQMTSCAEATFYLEHCPGMEIDGDGDGIPCESQHCRH